MRIGYLANATHAQAVLGVASGEFAKAVAPAKLTTRVFNAGPALIEALNAGEIDIGYVGPGPAIAAYSRSRGEALRIISGSAANGVVIVANASSNISTIDDLKGRRIATPQVGNTQDISARHFLSERFGKVGVESVIAVPNAEQRNLMTRGQIDAAWVPEPWGALLVAEAGGKIIAEEKDLWPDKRFLLTVVVAPPTFLRDHPDVVNSFLTVHRDLTKRLQSNTSAELPALQAALADLTKKQLPEGVLTNAMTRIEFTTDTLPISLATIGRWTNELGFVREQPSLENIVDTTFAESDGTTKK